MRLLYPVAFRSLKSFNRTLFATSVIPVALVMAFGASARAAKNDPLLDELALSTGGKIDISYHSSTSLVRFLHVRQSYRSSEFCPFSVKDVGPEPTARNFLVGYGRLFGLTDQSREMFAERIKTEDNGRSFVRFQQKIDDVPVFGGELIVQTDSFGKVVSVNGKTSPGGGIDTTPSVGASAVVEKAVRFVAKHYHTGQSSLNATGPELWIYNPSLLGSVPNANRLVWLVEVKAVDLRPIDELVLIDAHSGRVVLNFNQTGFARNRAIYDDNDVRTNLFPGDIGFPGVLARLEDPSPNPTGDPDVDNAYDFAGYTYDFYHDYLGRDSIDNAGEPLIGVVRYCSLIGECPLQDVYWDPGHELMVYGEGYVMALDIVAHELTHGVTQHTSNLFNYMQSGAVSESISDVFGKLVELTYLPPPPPYERWWVGQYLTDWPIRDMQNARIWDGANWNQAPDKMTSSYYSCSFNQGTYSHINSSVNNKAAYLMVDGGTFNGKTVTGLGIDKVAKIYYEAQTNLLTSGSDYEDLYSALQLACENLTGTSGITAADCQQVTNAVDAVEMNLQPTSCAATEAPVCGEGLVTSDNIFFDDFESGGGNWSHSAVTGADAWTAPATGYATSGTYSIWGQDPDSLSESYITMKSGVTLPAGAYMHFSHAYDFEADSDNYYDGGVLEYLTSDPGSQWTDAGPLILTNGYNGFLAPWNPFGVRTAFTGTSYGYISSRLDLHALAGKNVKFRFGVGSDDSFGSMGWYIDDVRIYACLAPITIDSNPGGLQVVVDGISYKAPYTFNWAPGSGHTLSVASLQDGAAVRYAFTSWSDGKAQSHSITVPASPATYTVNFVAGQYELVSAVSPPGVGTVNPNCSTGCWYAAGATASLAAVTGISGYAFDHWSGDCNGTSASATVLMGAPKDCTANFTSCSDVVKIGDAPYASVQAAFSAPPQPNDIIKAAATTFNELSLNYNSGVSINLSGGYNCGFTSNSSGCSVILGSLTVTSGKVTIENFMIK